MTLPVESFEKLVGQQADPIKSERDDMATQLQAKVDEVEKLTATIANMKAKEEFTAKVIHYGSQLKETNLGEDAELHGILAKVNDDDAKVLVKHFKALSAQAELGAIDKTLGATGAQTIGDPVAAFDQAVKERMDKDNVNYPTALNSVRASNPELFNAYWGVK